MRGCHKQEYSILCHERFWQSIPAKAIVHVIEDAFLATTKIVEFHDVSCTRLVIVSQYTSVGIFAFPNVKVSLYSPLSLYDKTIRFSFPFLNKDENSTQTQYRWFQQFSIQLRQTWNRRRRASVGTNIKMPAMSLYHIYDFLRTWAAIHAGTRNIYFRSLQSLEDSFQSFFLVEAHVCVAVSIFQYQQSCR